VLAAVHCGGVDVVSDRVTGGQPGRPVRQVTGMASDQVGITAAGHGITVYELVPQASGGGIPRTPSNTKRPTPAPSWPAPEGTPHEHHNRGRDAEQDRTTDQFAQLAVGVLGVVVISNEYSSGMIRATLAAVPGGTG
jgi:hypothetical protein